MNNTQALQNLKNLGYRVTVRHYRKWANSRELVADQEFRRQIKCFAFKSNIWMAISQRGGATDLILEKDDEKIVVRATCYHRDNFARKLGVRAALDKLKSLHNIGK